MLDKLYYRLSIFYSIKNGFKYDPDEKAYLNSLTETLLLLPEVDELKKRSLAVRILMEDQICLPDFVYNEPWEEHADADANRRTHDRIRFVISHPRYIPVFMKRRAKRYWKKFKRAVKI